MLTPEPINGALRDHAASRQDWEHRGLVQELHAWAKRFDDRFGLELQTPAIRVERLRVNVLGSYRNGRNGFGVQHEVTINDRWFDKPRAELLETVFHELLHLWQRLHGKPGKRNYHNAEFRKKAASYGLAVDARGCTVQVQQGPFTKLLEEHGVDTGPLLEDDKDEQRPEGTSTQNKWSCACTNVRAAVELEMQCLRCGQRLKRAKAAW